VIRAQPNVNAKQVSLDHLVGAGEERGRDFEADVARRLLPVCSTVV